MNQGFIRSLTGCVLTVSLMLSMAMTARSDEDTTGAGNSAKQEPHALSYSSRQDMLSNMELMAENQNLQLYFDRTNLTMAVKNTGTGQIYTSNPYNSDGIGLSSDLLDQVKSQIILSYYDNQNNLDTMNSYADAVKAGQFDVQKIKDGVQVKMSLGVDVSKEIIPACISEQSFQKNIVDKLNGKSDEVAFIEAYYNEMNLKDIQTVLTNAVFTNDQAKRSSALVYVVSQYSDSDKEYLQKYLEEAGYTHQMMENDLKACGVSIKENQAFFTFTLRYTLKDGCLYATLPASSINFDKTNYQIERINFLPYFGASSEQESPDGYLFIPDGCGAIANFNDKSPNKPALISNRVYKNDASVSDPNPPDYSEGYSLPVFGIKTASDSVFAIIEEGSGLSGISSSLGGIQTPYYCSYPYFIYAASDGISLTKNGTITANVNGSGSTLVKYDKNYYKGNYTVRYSFLSGNDSNYIGMANCYKNYLVGQGMNKSVKNRLTFTMETIGTTQTTGRFLFIPYQKMEQLTEYTDNIQMMSALKALGVDSFSLLLEGWQKDGLDYCVNDKYRPSGVLGGNSGLKTLEAYCRSNGVSFYPIAEQAFVAKDEWFDGFSPYRDVLRRINGQFGMRSILQLDTTSYKAVEYAVSPKKYVSFIESFLKSYRKSGANSVSFGLMGSYLNGDDNSKSAYNREQSLQVIEKALKSASGQAKLAFSGSNAYCLPYADMVYNVPLTSSSLPGESYDIPFLQMVLNGSVNYSAPPVNTATDIRQYLLECIESRSSPTFELAYRNTETLKLTDHDDYYNVDFNEHKQDFASEYQYVKDAIGDVVSEPVVQHERLTDDVVYIRYANNRGIYINYSDQNVTVNDVTVPALGYKKV